MAGLSDIIPNRTMDPTPSQDTAPQSDEKCEFDQMDTQSVRVRWFRLSDPLRPHRADDERWRESGLTQLTKGYAAIGAQ